MANKAAQFIYRCIVNLHPAEFRDKFGREMLLDFQEGAAGLGCTRFFTDALISLGRQWLHTPASVGFPVPLSAASTDASQPAFVSAIIFFITSDVSNMSLQTSTSFG